jgi:perosamine synthetase
MCYMMDLWNADRIVTLKSSENVLRKRIDWWKPVMGEREKRLLCDVIDSNFPNDGEYTTAFEQRIAKICGVPYAVAVTSGTAAIFLGLVACGVGQGDEVIVPDITFIATANAVRLAGASPVLVDVDPNTFCIDPGCVEAAVTSRTKAIIPVHISGRAAALTAIIEIARKHNLRLVEDAAEAFGSKMRDGALGSFGDVGCLSFTATKIITTGQGGMVLTRDRDIHQRLRELKDEGRPERGTGGADQHISLGYNFKLTNLQAAMGLAQLETLDSRQDHLRHLFGLYRELLCNNPRVRLPGFDINGGECPLWIDALVDGRDNLHDYLLTHDIHCRKFWYPIHTQAPYRSAYQRFPISMTVSSNAIWLPSALTLNDNDIRLVCQEINEWARKC